MRPWKNRSDAEQVGAAGAGQRRRQEGRGWGPFTGGQLTVVIVAIAAMFAIPTAALAAGDAFSNNSATVPALKATNANAHGIGVQGTGKKYGVLSNGPLGVAAGKSLSCTGCVGPAALSAAARAVPNLGSGQSESGTFATSGSLASVYLSDAITYARPLASPIPNAEDTSATGTDSNCPGPGSAAAGYLCLYPLDFANINGSLFLQNYPAGVVWYWGPSADGARVAGQYTVRAP